MQWNLRLVAAQRGIWKASELRSLLADHGLVISAGKMSGLWSGRPVTIKLSDLDVICVVLGCEVGEVLVPEPDTVRRPQSSTGARAVEATGARAAATPQPVSRVVPRRRDGRSLPPVPGSPA